jgi:hypothetical protein
MVLWYFRGSKYGIIGIQRSLYPWRLGNGGADTNGTVFLYVLHGLHQKADRLKLRVYLENFTGVRRDNLWMFGSPCNLYEAQTACYMPSYKLHRVHAYFEYM